ncbi:MAG: Sulfopyruvate decarboxylase - beta subunit, partial [uncultured Acetobacteraceae bacterium]
GRSPGHHRPQRPAHEPGRPDAAPRVPVDPRRGRGRRHRQHQFRPLGGRAPGAEFLHARQHGPRRADRPRRRAGAARPQGLRAGRRRVAADATRLPVHGGEPGAAEPRRPGLRQRRLPDHGRPAHAGGGGRHGPHGGGARLRPQRRRVGRRRNGVRADAGRLPCGGRAARGRPQARRPAARRANGARPGADPRPLHAGHGREAFGLAGL